LRSGKDITVYTFGEPRVGDYTFAKKFNSMISESYRVVHSKDIVPHTPFCIPANLESLECRESPDGPFHHGTEILKPPVFPKKLTRDCFQLLNLSDDLSTSVEFGMLVTNLETRCDT
ncbi:hypothetical protein COOONC_16375, partial [Cooperia oncophora]